MSCNRLLRNRTMNMLRSDGKTGGNARFDSVNSAQIINQISTPMCLGNI
jgi:hypothetical protein